MATTDLIRHRLIIIVLLGVVVAALSLFALDRALSTSMATRLQRAEEMVTIEVERLAAATPSQAELENGSKTNYVGLRGGWVTTPADLSRAPGLPPAWLPPVADAVGRATVEHRRVLVQHDLLPSPNMLVAASTPTRAGGVAWVAYMVVPLPTLSTWRWVTIALAIATALLVFAAVSATLSFRRSAAALNATLVALGKDLTTTVPTPRAPELHGIADGIRGLAHDLVESREATERLMRELAQQERLAALGRVAAGVAHEVRNPLASIKLRLDLSATGELPDSARQAVAAASAEIARLDRLVSDLLLVAGRKLGPRRPVGVAGLVRARIEALQAWATARGVTLQQSGDGDADVDADAVARALDNLLRNAAEASPTGAAVDVRIGDAGDAVVVQVEDRGAGVEPARAAELFEPFFTTKPDGTGLGLAICRAIARAHGGDVTYARAGAITRFTLTLPRAARAEAA